jgi:aspartate carbamoyltransferase catalytic subunit
MKNLLSINDLTDADINEILDLAESFYPTESRSYEKNDLLKGKSIVNLFFEDSTRTRVSFELAGKLLSADVINFSSSGSSLNKGESLRDTVQTISSMGFHGIVIRHKSAGVPWQLLPWTDASIVNAGDGNHQHPTQALLDLFTLTQRLGTRDLSGLRICLVGDLSHSRAARSDIDLFRRLGAEITVVGPPTLIPSDISLLNVTISHDLDETLTKCDVIYTIRPKHERINEALLPSMDEYITRYSLNDQRFARLDGHVLVMEAGPLIRGVQMSNAVADHERNLMNQQVKNGVAVRMAVLYRLLGNGHSND